MNKQLIISASILLFHSLLSLGQVVEERDTIRHAAISAERSLAPLSGVAVDLSTASRIISPTGEGDVIKYVQTIAGVSSGTEGSSSYFVRGGNNGNNLIELDGTRIYGTSHLLGFSTAISQDILSTAQFHSGSIRGEHSNLLSSVLDLRTKDAARRPEASLSLSNFFAGASFSTPIVKDKLSVMASARYSPFGKEYGLISSIVSDFGEFLPQSIGSTVYDIFAKLSWTPGIRTKVSLSYFKTVDDYKLLYTVSKWDKLGWGNDMVNLRVQSVLSDNWLFSGNASLNRFANSFSQYRFTSFETDAFFELQSALNDVTLSGKLEYNGDSPFKQSFGYKFSGTRFHTYDTPVNCLLGNLWYQAGVEKEGMFSLQAMLRGNLFASGLAADVKTFFNPETSLSATYYLTPALGLALSADYLTQYYHLVEGLPTGWSMDLMVPASRSLKPETALQLAAGAFFKNEHHDLKVGAYYKSYRNLVFNPDAVSFFEKDAASGWKDHLHSGEGSSKGVESSYSYTGKKLNASFAYTFSHTDRLFADLCKGQRFPAKFDRPHILNINLDLVLGEYESKEYGFTSFFTVQSGHLESAKAGLVGVALPWTYRPGDDGDVDYFGDSFNNFRMPTYIRLDLGFYSRWETRHTRHLLNFGIFNVLNRHNPSFIYAGLYSDHHWEQLSIFPIMPSLSYKLTWR